ncbi:MAG: V-type ATP synthase subunit F [Dehalococcoidales bacterium]|nr:V-type ATP synthase subunit F [Dehalococcoidales bacterium]
MKVFVLGPEDTVLGFSLVGVEGETVGDPTAAASRLEEMRRAGEVGLVLITANLARGMGRRLDEFRASHSLPIVLEVAGPGEVVERPSARELLRRAVGAA